MVVEEKHHFTQEQKEIFCQYTALEIMEVYEQELARQRTLEITNCLLRFKGDSLSLDQTSALIHKAEKEEYQRRPKKDPKTQTYTRGELYNFLGIAKELGYEKVKAVLIDMNFLKDHNDQLGEPTGGDLALVVIADTLNEIARQYGFMVVRYQEAGGDDFIMVGLPQEAIDSLQIEREIKNILAGLSSEEYLQGKRKGKPVVNHETDKPFVLDDNLVRQLRAQPEFMEIIIPPSLMVVTGDFDLRDISEKVLFSGETCYDNSRIADAIEKIYGEIKRMKREKYAALNKNNPAGAKLLARKND